MVVARIRSVRVTLGVVVEGELLVVDGGFESEATQNGLERI
jgi:hypothetical protein